MSTTLAVTPESALEGLTIGQKERVCEWLMLYSISKRELAVWKAVRQKFVRSTAYKVPVATRVDEVCRDLFELKQFAQRIVYLLPKATLEVVAKKTQGAFSVKEIAHWRNAIGTIQLPFRFDRGSPQAELYALANARVDYSLDEAGTQGLDVLSGRSISPTVASDSNATPPGAMRSTPVSLSSTAASTSKINTSPVSHCSRVTSASSSTRSVMQSKDSSSSTWSSLSSPTTRQSIKRPAGRLTIDESPSKKVRSIIPASVKAKVVAVFDSSSDRFASTSEPTQLYRVGRNTASPRNVTPKQPMKTSTPGVSDASRSDSETRVALRGSQTTPTAAAVDIPAGSRSTAQIDTSNENPDKDFQQHILTEAVAPTPTSTSGLTAAVDAAGPCKNDSISDSIVNITPNAGQDTDKSGASTRDDKAGRTSVDEENPEEKPLSRLESFAGNPFTSTFPMLEHDLDIVEISPMLRKYLLQFRVEPIEYIWWLKQRRYPTDSLTQNSDILAKADEFLVFVANLLQQIPSLEKSAIPPVAKLYGVQAHSLEKWIHYRKLFSQDKTALKFSLFGESALRKYTVEDRGILQLENISRFKPPPKRRRLSLRTDRTSCSDQEVVERVMSFYMLSPAVLDQLPLPENKQVRESPEFSQLRPVQKLLYDLESIIINKCEVSQFQEMFPADAGRVCFGPALMNRSGRLRALYQLPLGDVLAAATEDNSRLRSKEIILPAYFDTAYDGAQPIVPASATCALVNAIHTGSTNRDRQRIKTVTKILDLLKKYGSIEPTNEVPRDEAQQEDPGYPQEFVVPFESEEEVELRDNDYFVYHEANGQNFDDGDADDDGRHGDPVQDLINNDGRNEITNGGDMYEIRVKVEPADVDS